MKKIYKWLSAFLSLSMVFASTFAGERIKASAGVSDLTVFEDSLLENTSKLSATNWLFSNKADNSGTYVENNIIGFEPTNADSRFNLKRRIEDLANCGVELNFELKVKLLLTDIPTGVRFVYAFGMPRVGTNPEEDSTVLYFENKTEGMGFGIAQYGDTVEDIVNFTTIKNFNADNYVDVVFNVYTDGTAQGSINGESFSASGCPTMGFVGFGQITKGRKTVNVKLKELGIKGFVNDTPENANCFEDFNNDCYNMNLFQAKSRASGLADSKLYVENNALRFNNTGSAYLETKYKYSNVDVSFDVFDVQKVNTFKEDGSVDVARSCAFGVAFGYELIGRGMQTKAPLVVKFTPKREAQTKAFLEIMKNEQTICSVELPEKYNMFKTDDVISVKISLFDSVVKVMLKAENEKGYTTVADQNIGFTPLGYFQVAALGAYDSNLQKCLGAEQLLVGSFTLDNLAIKNYDVGKKLKLLEYYSSNSALVGDYVYENDWSDDDLLQSTIK